MRQKNESRKALGRHMGKQTNETTHHTHELAQTRSSNSIAANKLITCQSHTDNHAIIHAEKKQHKIYDGIRSHGYV